LNPKTPVRGLLHAVLACSIAVLAVPAASSAQQETATETSRPPVARAASIYGSVTRHVAYGQKVRVRGRMRPGFAGRKVRVQRRTRAGWRTVARTRTGRGGRFRAAWRPRSIGRYRLRVRFAGGSVLASAGDRLARVHVYRASHASWYGPGLYGNSTACGGALTPWRLGVAHRSLPCGTKVTFRYRGRAVTVPVIDRGPYAAGREWDLTAATTAKLGFPDTGTVWSTR
jgi:rare lipoprotein A